MAFAAVPAAGSLIGGSALAAGVLPVAATTAATAGIGLGSAVGAGTFLNAMRIVGGIAQGVGTIRQGIASQQQTDFQSSVARQQVARQQQIDQLNQQQREDDHRRRVSGLTARAGGAGVTLGGSPTLLLDELTDEFLFNQALAGNESETTALRGIEGAELIKRGGKNARTASFLTAAGQSADLFGTVGNAFGGGTKKSNRSNR